MAVKRIQSNPDCKYLLFSLERAVKLTHQSTRSLGYVLLLSFYYSDLTRSSADIAVYVMQHRNTFPSMSPLSRTHFSRNRLAGLQVLSS